MMYDNLQSKSIDGHVCHLPAPFNIYQDASAVHLAAVRLQERRVRVRVRKGKGKSKRKRKTKGKVEGRRGEEDEEEER